MNSMTENVPAAQPTPVVSPAPTSPPTSVVSPLPTTSKPCPPGCNECVKGGLPLPKELTTFFLMLALIALTIGAILLVTAKREVLELQRQLVGVEEAASQPTMTPEYPLPTQREYATTIALPQPQTSGGLGVQSAIQERRSRRDFSQQPVTLAELGQVLWAAQGVTEPETGKRSAPSARESYPYTIYIVVRNVTGLEPGLYEYLPTEQALGKLALADAGQALNSAGVQPGAQNAPVVFIVSASLGKSAEKMGANAINSTMLEGGHIGQNMYLQAESLRMAMVVMAGFNPVQVRDSLQLDPAETPVYVIPFGHIGVPTTEGE